MTIALVRGEVRLGCVAATDSYCTPTWPGAKITAVPVVREYAVESLYRDQDGSLFVDAIPSLLAWFTIHRRKSPVDFRFVLDSEAQVLRLSWDVGALSAHDSDLPSRVRRLAKGVTAQREHLTELAAYVLALCAISVLLPGRRAVGFSRWVAPDILLEETRGAIRGVEVAGRSRGGLGALRILLDGRTGTVGKRKQLAARADLVEAYVSLWCATPAVSLWVQVKP